MDDLEAEVREQKTGTTIVAGTIWTSLNTKIWHKSRMYKTAVKTIMTYTVESTPDTTQTKGLLETTEMKELWIECEVVHDLSK